MKEKDLKQTTITVNKMLYKRFKDYLNWEETNLNKWLEKKMKEELDSKKKAK